MKAAVKSTIVFSWPAHHSGEPHQNSAEFGSRARQEVFRLTAMLEENDPPEGEEGKQSQPQNLPGNAHDELKRAGE
jgi:hypothetical protein